LQLEVSLKDRKLLGLVTTQSGKEERNLTADPSYLAAKAKCDRSVVERLEVAEALVQDQRISEALSILNGICNEHPFNRAAMEFKNNILEWQISVQAKRLEHERRVRNGEILNEISEAGNMPREPRPIPRSVIIFEEMLQDAEQQKVLDQLKVRMGVNYENAPLGTVIKEIFQVAGINYIIEDAAIEEKTLSIRLVDPAPTLSVLLDVIQRMAKVTFNYRGNTVYVVSADNPTMVTEVIYLNAGLTDTTKQPKLGSVSGSTEGGGGSAPDIFSAEAKSDLERFMEAIEKKKLGNWADGSEWYYEPKSNTLHVKSTPACISEVKRLVHALDYDSAMVLIEAKFVELSEQAEQELGIDWKLGGLGLQGKNGVLAGGIQSGGSSGSLFTSAAGASNPDLAIAAGSGLETAINNAGGRGLTLGIVGLGKGMNPNLEAKLSALAEKGEANNLSEPKVLTLSNHVGIIDIMRDFWYTEDYTVEDLSGVSIIDNNNGGTTGGSSVPQNRVIKPVPKKDSEGINFSVRPSVGRNSDIITMHVVPTVKFRMTEQYSKPLVSSANLTANATNVTVERIAFQTRRIATTLHVKSGQTVVIGGLISEEDSKQRAGIPLLMDIPYAGYLFSHESIKKDRRKLVIFITATLVDPSGAKLLEETKYLQDMARVLLPASIAKELSEEDARINKKSEEMRQEYLKKVKEEDKRGWQNRDLPARSGGTTETAPR
jgi:type II secretory pathway component GspD/PulD (secretin)